MPSTVKTKTRVGTLLKEAVKGKKSVNISADLTALTDRYNVMIKKLKHFASVLQRHHAVMRELDRSRLDLAAQITSLTKGTPMFSCGGDPENENDSFSAIHKGLSSKAGDLAGKYNQFIVQYVVEWERVVSTRVNAGLKTTETLRVDLDHYQKKVEELHLTVNKQLSKGKMVDDKTKEKLKRNEEKLMKAKQIHEKASRDMCMLLEETVDQGWKDLHPILIKMAQFDMTVANDEAKGLSEMDSVVTALKALAASNDLNPAGRLKALGAEKVSDLYTGTTHKAITNGNEGYNSYTSYENSAPSMPPGSVAPQGMGGYPLQVAENDIPSLPPGSVAPQGMGGFPVQVGSDEFNKTAPNNAIDSHWNNPVPISTSDMLAVASSAAPPPTLDQIDISNSENQYSAPNQYSASNQYSAASTNPFGSGPGPAPSTNPFGPSDGIKITAAPAAPPPPPPPGDAPPYQTMNATSFNPTQMYAPSTNPFDDRRPGGPPTNPFNY